MSRFKIGCLTAGIIIALFVGIVFGAAHNGETNVNVSEESSPEIFLPDTDGDGFSDKFEEQMELYDPNVPNDRYIILFEYHPEEEGLNGVADSTSQFFAEKGKVPTENIIMLKQEKAIRPNLQKAIEEVAAKADENDLVFLSIDTHGSTDWIGSHPSYTKEWYEKKYSSGLGPEDPPYPGINYIDIDKWLDTINAKVVIVRIMACGCESALPVLRDGHCPRIVFVYTGREFISGLGEYQYVDPLPPGVKYEEMRKFFLEDCITVDTKHGNGDGYVSLKEVANWLDNDTKWAVTTEGGYEKSISFIEATGYSRFSDASNISSQIYLTDYKIPG